MRTGRSIGQARNLPLDAHLHTYFSADSDVPIDDYAAQAVERGIGMIAITDHIDFDPRLPNFAPDVAARERTVREAAERWAPSGLTILFGVEVTYESPREAEIRDHLARQPYDFSIGSVHLGPGSPYAASRVAAWCGGRSLEAIVEPYFSEVESAARSGLFDALGHLDFVKRFIARHVTAEDLAGAPELYEPILLALIESGMALEVNTSGLRQAAHETYPSPAVVARFRALGGGRVTAGSDAHQSDSFAFGLEEGYRHLAAAGFGALSLRHGGTGVELPAMPDVYA